MVYPTLLQTLAQFFRRNIHQLHLAGIVKYGIRDALTDAHMGDGCNYIMKALQMLHINGGIHVYACIQEFNHILIAFPVAAALGIGMGQLIHQDQVRPAYQGGIQIKLPQRDSLIFHGPGSQEFQPVKKGHGIRPVMGFNIPGHHIPARFLFLARRIQHGICLAHAGRISEEYL